jgi:hypothetical protein
MAIKRCNNALASGEGKMSSMVFSQREHCGAGVFMDSSLMSGSIHLWWMDTRMFVDCQVFFTTIIV